MGEIRREGRRARHRKVEGQSQHLSWKLMGNVTSYGVETEREGVTERDGGVVGVDCLVGSQSNRGDRGGNG